MEVGKARRTRGGVEGEEGCLVPGTRMMVSVCPVPVGSVHVGPWRDESERWLLLDGRMMLFLFSLVFIYISILVFNVSDLRLLADRGDLTCEPDSPQPRHPVHGGYMLYLHAVRDALSGGIDAKGRWMTVDDSPVNCEYLVDSGNPIPALACTWLDLRVRQMAQSLMLGRREAPAIHRPIEGAVASPVGPSPGPPSLRPTSTDLGIDLGMELPTKPILASTRPNHQS